ncbi:MAG: photosystem II reaction center protein Psb28 [Trichodesmium sp. MAG_R03]|nr:photosystem II reaction center protein Psb28 [Trichodesmium sp. MAG_R03]
MAAIQFIQGMDEEVTPDIKLTRSRNGKQGTATLTFENPKAVGKDVTQPITGMYMIDEEGQITSRDVKLTTVNGEPKKLEGFYVMKSQEELDRFMRFMGRYAEEYGLEFTKARSEPQASKF